jgi:hypothetical protein
MLYLIILCRVQSTDRAPAPLVLLLWVVQNALSNLLASEILVLTDHSLAILAVRMLNFLR